MELEWTAPTGFTSAQTVEFFFTALQSKSIFWTKASGTNDVEVRPSAAQPQSSEAPKVTAKVYEGCGETKGCFGLKAGCEGKKNCQVMATYQKTDSNAFQFEIYGSGLASGGYVAVGLSNDAKMGDDLVFSCSNGGSGVDVRWNQGKSNQGGVEGVTVSNAKVETRDGATTCSFTVPEKLKFTPPSSETEKTFDLSESPYHVLVATGAMQGQALSYHAAKLASGEAADLKSAAGLKASEGYFVQIHGVLMATAWIASSTCGMLMARYFKETWRNVKPGGKDLWFRCHQVFMTLAVLLTVVSFIVIVSGVGFYPYPFYLIQKNPHPAVGLTCIVCALIQPVMAFFRPHPGTSKRWMFDWGHWLVGNLAFLFAVVTLFLAVDLPPAHLPKVMSKVLLAFVVVHVLVHVLLTVQRIIACQRQRHIHDVANSAGGSESDLPGSGIRKVIIVLYIIFVWSVAIAVAFLIFGVKMGIDYDAVAEPEAEGEAEAQAEGEPESG